MKDYRLRFEDEAAALAALAELGLTTVDESGRRIALAGSPLALVAMLGPVETAPAVVDAEGVVISPAVVDQRCHVDIRWCGQAEPDLEPAWIVEPSAPRHTFGPLPVRHVLTKPEFLARFSLNEIGAVYRAAAESDVAAAVLAQVQLYPEIDVAYPATIQGVVALIGLGLLAPERREAILAPVVG